jgi:hypothetical protein
MRMRPSVPWLATILVVAICTAIAGSANAQYPYSAGYALGGYPAGQVSPGLSTGLSPTTYAPATANVPGTTFVAGPTYAAGYAPSASTFIDPAASAPLVANGTYQAQRPAYFDNPSVYSGLPTLGYNSGYQSLRAPLTDSLRGSAVATGAVEGYPTTYFSAYDGSLPGAPMTVTTPTGAPVTSIPATTVTPIYPAAPPQSECCLSRFFR